MSLRDGSPLFAVTVESSGGATGSGDVRNPEYPLLMEEVLRRLSSLDVDLMDAFVDSRRVAHLPEAERRINVDGRPFPITLAPDDDFTALRRGLTRPQGDIGSSRSIGGGNQRKRATLVFKSSTPKRRSDLIESLHARESGGRGRRSGITTGLSAAHLEAAIADRRRMGRDDFLAKYRAPAARRYVVVDGDDEMDAMALILGARAIAGLAIESAWRGDRENVATPLRRLGFAVEDLERPTEGPLGPADLCRPIRETRRHRYRRQTDGAARAAIPARGARHRHRRSERRRRMRNVRADVSTRVLGCSAHQASTHVL